MLWAIRTGTPARSHSRPDPRADAEGVARWIEHDQQAAVAVRLVVGGSGADAMQVVLHLLRGVDEKVQMKLRRHLGVGQVGAW